MIRSVGSWLGRKARRGFGAAAAALTVSALVLIGCGGDNGTNSDEPAPQAKGVPASVLPSAIKGQVEKAMPIYSGNKPPNIGGQYVVDNVVLAGSSDSEDSIGGIRGTERYIAFTPTSNGSKFGFRVKQGDYQSDEITADVVGDGSNFSAYFVETDNVNGIRCKYATIFSGTTTKAGISNIHWVIILVEKGSDPNNKVDPVNTYRVYKSQDNIATISKWFTVTITVTLNINGGSGSASPITLDDGDSVALPEWNGYAKSGYIFDGWNTASDGSGDSYPAGAYYTPIAGVDITLYAKWIKESENVPASAVPNGIRSKFALSMPLNSGDDPPDISGQYVIDNIKLESSSDSNDVAGSGVDDDLYIAFTKGEGGKFTINTKQGGKEYESKDVKVVGNGGDFSAYFIETGTEQGITYEKSIIISGKLASGGSGGIRDLYYSVILIKKGSDPQNKLGPVNTYRVYKDGDGTGSIRQWITIDIVVVINVNGGNGKALELTPDAEGYVTLPSGDGFSRNGYIFYGWNTKADGTGTDYKPGSRYKPAAGITLYIRWIAEAEYVPPSVLPNEIRAQFEDLMPLYFGAAPPDISGQYVANNFTLDGSSIKGDDIGQKFAELYVAFIKNGGKLAYRERQDGDDFGGDDVTVTLVGSGSGFTAFFTAAGSAGGVSFKQATLISGTLASNGIKDFYYAYIVLEKGADPQNQFVPVNTYRIFKDGDGLAQKQNWWTPPAATQYTVTFDANGGSGTVRAITVDAGESVTLPDGGFTRSNYTFSGWSTDKYSEPNENGVLAGKASYKPTGNVTFYAVWKAVTTGSACSIDGYKTTTIGNQTWMAENLNCDVGVNVCYDNDPANCRTYGRLYDWDTALEACPAGWHLPSRDEWNTLINYAGGEKTAGTKLKSATGWSSSPGTDDYKFTALPGGGYGLDQWVLENEGGWERVGIIGEWWTSFVDDRGTAEAVYVSIYDAAARGIGTLAETKLSVRCVKDGGGTNNTGGGSPVNAANEAWVMCNPNDENQCLGVIFWDNGAFYFAYGDHGDWWIDEDESGTWSTNGNRLTTVANNPAIGSTTHTYSISGNTLTVTLDGETEVYTKRSGINLRGLGKKRQSAGLLKK